MVMIFDRIARWTVWIFFSAFITLIGIGVLASDNSRLLKILVIPTGLVIILSAVTHVCAMVLRDAVANKWRFSLRTVLMATTLIAVVLGLIMWRVR